MSQEITLTLTPGAANMQSAAGKFMSVKSCSLPLSVAFNGGPEQTVSAGMILDRSAAPIVYVNLRNQNAVAVTITFYVADAPVPYAPADNSVSMASEYAFGNLGVVTNTGANSAFAGSPACDALGYLQITDGMNLRIDNTNNGHRRTRIVFTMSDITLARLNILDAAGRAYASIIKGGQISLNDDCIYFVSGAQGVASVTIGQNFLA